MRRLRRQDWIGQVIQAQRGDMEAFDALVRRFQDMAVGYAYSILGDFGSAEDAAHLEAAAHRSDSGSCRVESASPAGTDAAGAAD